MKRIIGAALAAIFVVAVPAVSWTKDTWRPRQQDQFNQFRQDQLKPHQDYDHDVHSIPPTEIVPPTAPVSTATSTRILPLFFQQLLTKSSPIQVDSTLSQDEEDTSGSSDPSSIDTGDALFARIVPNMPADTDPMTRIPPVHSINHIDALPQRTEVIIGDHLSRALPVRLRHTGVPGIEDGVSQSGNRSLWFQQ